MKLSALRFCESLLDEIDPEGTRARNYFRDNNGPAFVYTSSVCKDDGRGLLHPPNTVALCGGVVVDDHPGNATTTLQGKTQS